MRNKISLVIIAAVAAALGAVAINGCGSSCDASNCSGCCDANNTCQSGASDPKACGQGGAACNACATGQTCHVGICGFGGAGGNGAGNGNGSGNGAGSTTTTTTTTTSSTGTTTATDSTTTTGTNSTTTTGTTGTTTTSNTTTGTTGTTTNGTTTSTSTTTTTTTGTTGSTTGSAGTVTGTLGFSVGQEVSPVYYVYDDGGIYRNELDFYVGANDGNACGTFITGGALPPAIVELQFFDASGVQLSSSYTSSTYQDWANVVADGGGPINDLSSFVLVKYYDGTGNLTYVSSAGTATLSAAGNELQADFNLTMVQQDTGNNSSNLTGTQLVGQCAYQSAAPSAP